MIRKKQLEFIPGICWAKRSNIVTPFIFNSESPSSHSHEVEIKIDSVRSALGALKTVYKLVWFFYPVRQYKEMIRVPNWIQIDVVIILNWSFLIHLEDNRML